MLCFRWFNERLRMVRVKPKLVILIIIFCIIVLCVVVYHLLFGGVPVHPLHCPTPDQETLQLRRPCYGRFADQPQTITTGSFQAAGSRPSAYVYSAYVDDRRAPDVSQLFVDSRPVLRVFAWMPRHRPATCSWHCLFWHRERDFPLERPVIAWTDLNYFETNYTVMPVMLICELPVPAASDDDVIDAVSVVASPCERPRNILLPVDLRRRRKRRRKPTSEKPTSHDPSPPSSSSSGPDSKVEYVVEFTVCVPPLYGNISTVDLVEFIEVNRMFGAEKFQFYIESSTPEVETCLNKYRQLGVVDVQPWSMPDPLLHPEELVYYHGQILAMNECGYRQMYDAKYLLIQDIDEFVVPTQAQDWSSMLDDVSTGFFAVRKDRVGSYSFRNRFFPLDSPDVDHQDEVPSAVAQYGFRTLTKRTAGKLYPRDERGKTMSRPERTVMWHVHSVLDSSLLRSGDVNVFVDDDLAELVHYRQTNGDASRTFTSTQMLRFKSTIIERLQIGIGICLR